MKLLILVLALGFIGVFYFDSKEFGFKYTYIFEADPAEVWNEVKLSLTDSQKSKIWPNKLEVLKADDFKVGQVVNSTMYIKDKQFPVQFKITEINIGESVKFQPLDSNFQGSDKISVDKLDSGLIKLEWSGNYSVKKITLGALFFKYYYLSKFYDVFYQNIDSYWPIIEADKKVY